MLEYVWFTDNEDECSKIVGVVLEACNQVPGYYEFKATGPLAVDLQVYRGQPCQLYIGRDAGKWNVGGEPISLLALYHGPRTPFNRRPWFKTYKCAADVLVAAGVELIHGETEEEHVRRLREESLLFRETRG